MFLGKGAEAEKAFLDRLMQWWRCDGDVASSSCQQHAATLDPVSVTVGGGGRRRSRSNSKVMILSVVVSCSDGRNLEVDAVLVIVVVVAAVVVLVVVVVVRWWWWWWWQR